MQKITLTISSLRDAYRTGALTPMELVSDVYARCDKYESVDPAIWLHRLPLEVLQGYARKLEAGDPASLPLYGIPFAIKDNIDLADTPTTAGCPGYSYLPKSSSHVVARLIGAGAIPIGKTNLDQFATGLVGTRSPLGAPRNIFNRDYISGGSSSGSAVAVAADLCSFSLGTDTAGSGRVPAALNGLVGLKPSRGLLSTRGVVPACRSLDCVSIFSKNCSDARAVLAVARDYDAEDPFSKTFPTRSGAARAGAIRIGIPRADQHNWFGNGESPRLFEKALDRFKANGAELQEVDFSAFLEAARLLYEGPWTAERYAAVGEFIDSHAGQPGIDPVVAGIIGGGKRPSAVDVFRAGYRLAGLRRQAEAVLAEVDALAAPTIGSAYTVEEVMRDPVRLNSDLGYYNNFMNLLDLCGITLPAGQYEAGPGFGLTLIAPAGRDQDLLELGSAYLQEQKSGVSAIPADWITLAVCGAHLKGFPLHYQLEKLDARYVASTQTSPHYRLYALANTVPEKPGLVRVAGGGGGIAVETYALSPEAFGKFVASIPAPMTIGTAELANGRWVKSFLCEPCALADARDISEYGGWAAYCLRDKSS